jgi:hypothetical protein
MHKPSDLYGIASRLQESLQTTDSRSIQKACLKALEAMASDDAEFWPRGQSLILEFITGRARSSRDRAFQRLTRLALKWGDEPLIASLLAYGLGHITVRRKSSTPFLPLVLDGVCAIGRRMAVYRAQVIDSLKKVLGTSMPCPGSVFVTFLDLAQGKGDGQRVGRSGADIFAGHEMGPPVGDDARTVYEWKQSRSRVTSLYQLEMTTDDVGNSPVKHRVLDPKGKAFQLYADVVARFAVAISAPSAMTITVPSFLAHLKDQVRGERTPCLWETIQAMLTENFATVNYVQLLYALALTKKPIEPGYLQSVIVDLYESWREYKDRQQPSLFALPKAKKDVPFKSQPFRPHGRPK